MANEITFLLRFDTASGEKQIRQLSSSAKSALTKAFSIAPKSASLSDSLGIKAAVSDLSVIQSAISKLDNIMRVSSRESNRSITSFRPNRPLHEEVKAFGLDQESLRQKLQQKEIDIRVRRADEVREGVGTGRVLTGSGKVIEGRDLARVNAGGLASDEIIKLQRYEASQLRIRTREFQRTADKIAQADKERIKARWAESASIITSIKRGKVSQDALKAFVDKSSDKDISRILGPSLKGTVEDVRTAASKEDGLKELGGIEQIEAKLQDAVLKEIAAQKQRTVVLNKITSERVKLEGRLIRGIATQQEKLTLAKLHTREPQAGRGQFDEISSLVEAKKEGDKQRLIERGRVLTAAREKEKIENAISVSRQAMLRPFIGSAKAARTEANKQKGQEVLAAKIAEAIEGQIQAVLKEAQAQRQRTVILNKITSERVKLEGRLARGLITQQERSTLAKLQQKQVDDLLGSRIKERGPKGRFTGRTLSGKGEVVTNPKEFTPGEAAELVNRDQAKKVASTRFMKGASDRKARVEAGKRFAAARVLGLVNEGETLEDFSNENELKRRKFHQRLVNQKKADRATAAREFREARDEGFLKKGDVPKTFLNSNELKNRRASRAMVTDAQEKANLAIQDFKSAQSAGLTKAKETYKDFLRKPNELADRQRAAGLPVGPANVGRAPKPQSFEDIKAQEDAFAHARISDWNKEFTAKGGKPSAIQKLFGAREQSREQFLDSKRNAAKAGFSKLGKIGPEQALGISPTATRLLALSSVLQPLNSQLGMVAMQAGFAAFSLGAPVAALALLSAAIGGFRNLLMKSVETAKAAGLETRKYNRATTELAVEMRSFMLLLGIKTQQAFVPVVNKLTELFEEVEKLPWDDMIKGAAAASGALLGVTKFLYGLYEKGMMVPNAILSIPSKVQGLAGLEGSQQLDSGKVFKSLFGNPLGKEGFFKTLMNEIREMFQPPVKEKPEQFVYTPKFDFSQIEDLHMMIQKSIFKAEEKDPTTKAIEALPSAIRAQLHEENKGASMKDLLDAIQRKVPLPAVAG